MVSLPMTDFHKLFMAKINNMIEKKTGGIFLVVYVIYGILVYIVNKKTVYVLFTPPDCRLHTIYETFENVIKM